MEPSELQSKRWQVGIIAILLMLAAVVTWQLNPENQAAYGALLRVGTLLGAFWLAIPVLVRHPKILKRLPWYMIAGLVFFVAFAKRFWMLIPFLALLAFLSMFAGKRPGKRR
ncbi:MAG: hypothetical protein JKY95_01635 [Planctomycetaceae bacterium]|nr:hypothetical protein [Planctomycetaceae bacterium]